MGSLGPRRRIDHCVSTAPRSNAPSCIGLRARRRANYGKQIGSSGWTRLELAKGARATSGSRSKPGAEPLRIAERARRRVDYSSTWIPNRCGISRFLIRTPPSLRLGGEEGGMHVTLDAYIGVPSRPYGGKARPWPAGTLSRRDQATSAGAIAGRPRTHWKVEAGKTKAAESETQSARFRSQQIGRP